MLGVARAATLERDPEVFFGTTCFFEGLGYQGQTTPFTEKVGFGGLAAEGGKANKPLVSGKCVVFWPWYPKPGAGAVNMAY